MNTRCGYIAILGVANAGKSTLMNRLVGQKLAIVTPKVQTTRNRITGVCLEGEAQLIFIDTPGIFQAKTKFEKAMVSSAWSGAADADVLMVLVDCKRGICDETKHIVEFIKDVDKPKVLILNKIDLIAKPRLLELVKKLDKQVEWEQVFMISAKKGDGVEDIKPYLAQRLPEGPWMFPEDQLSDITERLLASEITREKLFLKLQQELPYSIAVETEKWENRKDGSVKIDQIIYVERENQKKIILGKGGEMLKSIGQRSRAELEAMWECRVHLFLHVKVRKDWKNNPEMYNYLGLEYK